MEDKIYTIPGYHEGESHTFKLSQINRITRYLNSDKTKFGSIIHFNNGTTIQSSMTDDEHLELALDYAKFNS